LPVPLQAVVHLAKELRDLLMANRMVLAREFRRQRARALAGPAQRGLRVAPRQRLHQGLQRPRQLGVAKQERVTSSAGTPDTTGWRDEKCFASWLGLSPGSKITGGKLLSGRTKPCANRAATALRLTSGLEPPPQPLSPRSLLPSNEGASRSG